MKVLFLIVLMWLSFGTIAQDIIIKTGSCPKLIEVDCSAQNSNIQSIFTINLCNYSSGNQINNSSVNYYTISTSIGQRLHTCNVSMSDWEQIKTDFNIVTYPKE